MKPASVPFGWIAFAAVNGAVAVAAGAYASHGLMDVGGQRAVDLFTIASRYQMWHALATIAVAVLSPLSPGRFRFARAFVLAAFAIGTVLFCGALYALALDGPRWFGALAPLGGTAFILGWLMLAVSALLHRP